ncbi:MULTISPECIES: hypothetical protein [Geobacillus]|jgi:hypothetical protein|uniref:Uncharacterized protein n=2 Tax=Geobacillus thermodenitrificans TaxID=33940 RepID=A4IRK9_GEOTN|nr:MULTISPECIES: hypothetical protein [Geobacillus]ABO67963.1 hypothetical protein GTNG_2618 [Geobacillus thermodenitrificans NG80-2]ARP43712.1 hypothetical protein GTHT12_02190 [Geobacillus thermodenitrificans]KQB92260.1 putative membrane protein [Geobacillus sp. PA-3]MEC5187152.1 hypothetical protein [Geobacillus thermodenitrificans]MED3716728.1 hypothetical protein [Geobacillus thermodenitrificans]
MDAVVKGLLIIVGLLLVAGIVYMAVRNRSMDVLAKILFAICACFLLMGLMYWFW